MRNETIFISSISRLFFSFGALVLMTCRGTNPEVRSISDTEPSASTVASTTVPSIATRSGEVPSAIPTEKITAVVERVFYKMYRSPDGVRFTDREFYKGYRGGLVVELNVSSVPEGTRSLYISRRDNKGKEFSFCDNEVKWKNAGVLRFDGCFTYPWELEKETKTIKFQLYALPNKPASDAQDCSVPIGTIDLSFPVSQIAIVQGNYQELGEMGEIDILLGTIKYNYDLECDDETGKYVRIRPGWAKYGGLDGRWHHLWARTVNWGGITVNLGFRQKLPSGTDELEISGDIDCAGTISEPRPTELKLECSAGSSDSENFIDYNRGVARRPLRYTVKTFGSKKMTGKRKYVIRSQAVRLKGWMDPTYDVKPAPSKFPLPPCRKEKPTAKPDHPSGSINHKRGGPL